MKLLFVFIFGLIYSFSSHAEGQKFSLTYRVILDQNMGMDSDSCGEALKAFVTKNIPKMEIINACSWEQGEGIQFKAMINGELVVYSYPDALENSCFNEMGTHIEIFTQDTKRYKIFKDCSWVPGEGHSLQIREVLKK